NGRTGKLIGNLDDIANGKVYVAKEALNLGLVDEIGYLPEAWTWVANQAHMNKPTVVKLQEKVSLLDVLVSDGSASGAKRQTQNVTVNGVNVELNPETLDRFATPKLMYLWRGQ